MSVDLGTSKLPRGNTVQTIMAEAQKFAGSTPAVTVFSVPGPDARSLVGAPSTSCGRLPIAIRGEDRTMMTTISLILGFLVLDASAGQAHVTIDVSKLTCDQVRSFEILDARAQ
ncbi:hypothetical protein JQ543_28165 [Bradyrhizobium diazoefficiens]|nr:hypothetical protein [Bradyrhizobium diazoefficiens]MBR0777245.1 hypothetical protein [Bradyrhizobium diazoefficiens]MBR0851647.1 hypothetical protein [Bradyrhizobium diazoefficiens]